MTHGSVAQQASQSDLVEGVRGGPGSLEESSSVSTAQLHSFRIFVMMPEGHFGGLQVREFGADEEAIAFGRKLLTEYAACDIWRDSVRVAMLRAEEASRHARR